MTARGAAKTAPAAELRHLKGVGEVLARRLHEAGLDSIGKIAAAGEEGLKSIPGISLRAVGSIVKQAQQLSESGETGDRERQESLKEQLAGLREKVQALAQSARERYQDKLTGKRGKKLSSDMVRIEDALGRLDDGGGQKRYKRVLKALTKAAKRVSGLEEASLKKIGKQLKRARKVVVKAL